MRPGSAFFGAKLKRKRRDRCCSCPAKVDVFETSPVFDKEHKNRHDFLCMEGVSWRSFRCLFVFPAQTLPGGSLCFAVFLRCGRGGAVIMDDSPIPAAEIGGPVRSGVLLVHAAGLCGRGILSGQSGRHQDNCSEQECSNCAFRDFLQLSVHRGPSFVLRYPV